MSGFKLYIHKNGKEIITENDIIIYIRLNQQSPWVKKDTFCMTFFETFMAGDIALDNGFEFQNNLTQAEVFVELL